MLFSSLCANFPTVDFIARLAFFNSLDPGAQQENELKMQAYASKFYRAQKKAIPFDK